MTLFDNMCAPVDFNSIVPKVLDVAIAVHKKHSRMHEALHSLANNDEMVNCEFIGLEDQITAKIAERLNGLGVVIDNPLEKIHFAMNVVQSFAHEYVFDKHEYIDYFIMRSMVEKTIIDLFK